MPLSFRSLLSSSQIQTSDLDLIFQTADQLRLEFESSRTLKPLRSSVIVDAFFEPSTRTRLSFQVAAQRLGLAVCGGEWLTGSSLVKEESEADTLLNIQAMNPDLILLRSKGDKKLAAIVKQLKSPVIVAGWGSEEHPTQALLDIYTLRREWKNLIGKTVLFVGDVEHSRVANSARALMQKCEMNVMVCSPSEFVPKSDSWKGIPAHSVLSEAVEKADAVIGLRVQKERHVQSAKLNIENYAEKFRLDAKNLQKLKANGLIMHPGPFVPMVDFDPALLSDSRCRVHRQVENGVWIRAALLKLILGERL